MRFGEKAFVLKDGRPAVLRSPREEDAEGMLAFIAKASGETDFLLRYPEEFADDTPEGERALLRRAEDDPAGVMITCLVGGVIAGSCQLSFRTGMKTRHRAGAAIAILREYWNLGIGTEMFREMIRLARARGGVRQIELEFIEGNGRARRLYEKMGFTITGVRPDAVCLRDGTLLNEYMMVKRL